MTRKLLVAALSLLIILTFFIQQNIFALSIQLGGEVKYFFEYTGTKGNGDYMDYSISYGLSLSSDVANGNYEIKGDYQSVVYMTILPPTETYKATQYVVNMYIYYIPSVIDDKTVDYYYTCDYHPNSEDDKTGFLTDNLLKKDDAEIGKLYPLCSMQKTSTQPPIINGDFIYYEFTTLDEMNKKIKEVNNGDKSNLDDGKEGTLGENGFEFSKIKYDLEVPLGFDSNTSQNHKYGLFANTGMFDSDKQDYTFKWYQSENVTKLPSYRDWELQFEISGFGNFRKILTPWDVTKFETPFLFLDSIPNFRNTYSTKFEDWSEIVESYLSNEYDIPIDGGGYAYAYNTPNFRLRNVWNDNEKGITHYSNWILIQCKKDGTYTVTEVNSKDIEQDNVKTDDLVDNKKTDSIYDGVSNDDVADNGKESFFGNVKSFLNSIGYVPEFFTKIFSFLPDWCLTFVGFGFTIIVAISVYKMVRG